MIPDGEYVAVLDRFEADLAILLVEDGGETIAEFAVPRWRLPDAGCHQDAVLEITVRNGIFLGARYDESETERRAEDAQSRFDRLSRRPPRDDEDEDGDRDGDEDEN